MDTLTAAASWPTPAPLALLVIVAAVAYALAVAVWPLTRHGRCNGTGKLRSPGGRAWRRCPGCGGTGTKIRLGRRVFEGLRSRR